MAVASKVSAKANGLPAIQTDTSGGFVTIYGILTLTGNYPGAPGDPWDITAMTLPPGWTLPVGKFVQGWAQSVNPAGASGFLYVLNGGPASALKNGVTVEVQASGGSGNPHGDISTAAYPAGVLSDTIEFCIVLQLGS